MHIVYVTIEYIDPVSLKIIDGGLANYLVKITKQLNETGNIIDVIVISLNFCISKIELKR